MEISVIGVNHRTAPVDVREKVSLPGDLARRLLQTVRAEKIFEEALVLDTCNRTEVYFVSNSSEDRAGDVLDHLVAHIAEVKQAPAIADTSVFYRHNGQSAVGHLFRVAASLDSQIVGEHEILDQLKGAYRTAVEARSARFLINKLMHWALRVGKRVQTETDLGRGTASVPQAAVELARHVFSSLEGKTVMLLGAGQTAESAAVALVRCGAGHVIVANRTLSRAEELAGRLLKPRPGKASARGTGIELEQNGCPARGRPARECSIDAPSGEPGAEAVTTRAIGLDEIPSVINEVDLLICSTGSSDAVLTYEGLAESIRRDDRPLLIVDIAVPRDVDPRLAELPDVFLYNIDDLNQLVAENIERRRMEIPRAEAIVDWEVEQFRTWRESLSVVPTIKLLRQHLSTVQEAEVKRYGKKFASSDRQQLEQFAQGMCNKILHQPIAFLRELSAENGSTEALAAVSLIRRLFNLDAEEGDADE